MIVHVEIYLKKEYDWTVKEIELTRLDKKQRAAENLQNVLTAVFL